MGQQGNQRFLLRGRGDKWQLLARGKGEANVARQYVYQMMAQDDPVKWRQAIQFLTSDAPRAARVNAEIRQNTLHSALATIREIYPHRLGPVIRADSEKSAQVEKSHRRQLAFYTWFAQKYAKQGEGQALAEALFHRVRLHWALGDLEAARQVFRLLLRDYGGVVMSHGPDGPETFRQVLSTQYWVTIAGKTPVRSYDYDQARRDAPFLGRQIRVEPKHTLIVAYPGSQLDGSSGNPQTAEFFNRRLKLWEGSFVVMKDHCISLSEFTRRP